MSNNRRLSVAEIVTRFENLSHVRVGRFTSYIGKFSRSNSRSSIASVNSAYSHVNNNRDNGVYDVIQGITREFNVLTNNINQDMAQSNATMQDRSQRRLEKLRSLRSSGASAVSDEYVNMDSTLQSLRTRIKEIDASMLQEKESSNIDLEPAHVENLLQVDDNHLHKNNNNINSNRSSSSNDSEPFEDHIYQNVHHYSDIMNSGVMRQTPQRTLMSDNITPRVAKRKHTISESSCSSLSIDDEYDYVTITKYVRARGPSKEGKLNSKEFYKTQHTVFHDDEKSTQTELSKVSFSTQGQEKEEVQFKDMRDYVVDELINTEDDYVTHIAIALDIYHKIMAENMVATDLQAIFGNLNDIKIGTMTMLEHIKEVRFDYEAVGQMFLNFTVVFDCYPIYCKNKKKSDLMCNKYNHLIMQIEKVYGDKLELSSRLLLPIQRLAKYKLLLEKLLKSLKEDNLPHVKVQEALLFIKSINLKGDNLVELDLICNKAYQYEDTGRFLMREDFRMLQPKRQNVTVFLFQRVVIIAKRDKQRLDNYIVKYEIHMEEISVTRSDEESTSFYLQKKRCAPFRLEAKTPEIKARWVDGIQEFLWKQLMIQKELNNQMHGVE